MSGPDHWHSLEDIAVHLRVRSGDHVTAFASENPPPTFSSLARATARHLAPLPHCVYRSSCQRVVLRHTALTPWSLNAPHFRQH
jgi:hypothetical protein